MSDSDSLPELLTPSQWNAENNNSQRGRFRGAMDVDSSSSSDNASESSDDESENGNNGDDIAQAIFSRYLATAFAAHLRNVEGDNSDDDDDNDNADEEEDDDRCPGCQNCQPDSGPPRLDKLLRDGDWNGAIKRMESNPDEVNWVDNDDENILHVALSYDPDNGFVPLNVVKKIVEKNRHGSDIIEHEVRTGDDSFCNVFDIIFSSLPSPEEKSELRLRKDVIIYLVSKHPSMAEAATEKFFEWMFSKPRVLEEARKCVGLETQIHDIPGHLNFVLSIADQLLYMKEYETPRGAKEKSYKFFLHSAMSCLGDSYQVPPLFYRLAISACRHEKFHGWDSINRTPLSIAISAKSFTISTVVRESILGILKIAPSTTRMMCDNVAPLHFAIRKDLKWDDGIKQILAETPNALGSRDIKTRLYPFMHAAAGHTTDLNTIFMLLQQDPLLACGLADIPPWQKVHIMKVENERLRKQNILLEALVNDYAAKEDVQDREIEEMKRVIEQLTREKDIAMKGEFLD